MPGDATILDYAQTCIVLFDNLLSIINGRSRPDLDSELSAQADDQSGRFSIWAGNIGVFATANASLDYRVRDTPQIKGLIIQQLDGLTKFLQRTIAIANHEPWHATSQLASATETKEDAGSSVSSALDSSSVSDSVESKSGSITRSPLKKGIKDVEKTISRLYRLSVTIRKSVVQSRKTKAANYVDRDESGHDMSSEFEKYATRLIKQKYPDISQVLCERLGYANSLRRRQFLYRERHQQKLSSGTKSRIPQGATKVMSGPPLLNPGVRDGARSSSKDLQSGHSPAVREGEKGTLLSQTMAPALGIHNIHPGRALSMVSTAITAFPVQMSVVLSNVTCIGKLPLDLLDAIVQQAKGNFLIARLTIDSLEQQSRFKFKKLLQNPSDLLHNYLDQIMRRINAQHPGRSALANKALVWILYTRRPLVFEELQQAVAIVPEADNIDPEASYEIQPLLSVTAGLLTVDEKHAVRLFHESARMCLGLHAKEWFPSAEVDIALAIISYLRIKPISEPCLGDCDGQDFKARRKSHPFLLYAAAYWGDHIRNVIHNPIVQATVLQYVRNPSNLASCVQAALWVVSTAEPIVWDPYEFPNSLLECAKFGLTPLIPELLNDGYGIDSQDMIYGTYGLTALMYACRAGHGETVRLLLDLGASVNIRSFNGITALLEAVLGGHTDSVELLLKRKDLDIDTVYADCNQRTVLMIAARNDAEEVVRCLLQQVDIDINKADGSGSTALILAAAEGHSSVVSLLLDHGIDINALDLMGRSAFLTAVDEGFREVVEKLLAKGADTSTVTPHGCTGIQRAVLQGKLSVLETLVAHGADIGSLDRLGRSLLHDATLTGSSEIVRFLLRHGSDPDGRCSQRYTPLHYAILLYKPQVTKVLLESGADTSLKDYYGRTPVVVAWQEGHVRLARMFEEQDSTARIEEEIPTKIAKTLPIWSVAKLGRADLLASILNSGRGFEERNPYTNDSAVHTAVSCKHNHILGMLLDAKLSLNCLNNEHQTPLHIAAKICNTQAVDLLLQYHAEIDPVNQSGDTPLQLALGQAEFPIAIQLIHASLDTTIDAKIEIPKGYIQLLFYSAIVLGNAKVLEFLIDKGADIMANDKNDHSALQLAETAGFGDVTETLETRMEFFEYKKRTKLLENTEE